MQICMQAGLRTKRSFIEEKQFNQLAKTIVDDLFNFKGISSAIVGQRQVNKIGKTGNAEGGIEVAIRDIMTVSAFVYQYLSL